MKGFKDFVMRGNLVELAVAFIMAAAFAAVSPHSPTGCSH
jgi:large conductance mechanosensitive channel